MGMVDAEGILLRGDVVAQHQIQLELSLPHTGNGRDGVMHLAIRLREHKGRLVRIAPPRGEDAIRQLHQTLIIFAAEPDHRHGPLDDARLHIREVPESHRLLNRRPLHGEGVAAALKVVVAQDGASHDGKIGVAAHKVVGEPLDKVQQLAEGGLFDLHGGVAAIEHDAVLVIVDVGTVLEEPILFVDGDGNDPVILPGGMPQPPGVALVLSAKHALRIAALGGGLCRGDALGVLLRLGEIDGDVQFPVGGGGLPLSVPRNAVAPDVVRVLTEAVKPVCGRLRVGLIPSPEFTDDLSGAGRQYAHQLGIEQVAAGDVVLYDAPSSSSSFRISSKGRSRTVCGGSHDSSPKV